MSHCRVLLVDDMPATLQALARLLRVEGCAVVTAASRREALQHFRSHRFHVAVIDVQLDPDNPKNRDGLRLMRDIKQIDPTTAVIILTRYADTKLVTEVLKPVTSRHSVYQLSRNLAAACLDKNSAELRNLGRTVRDVFDEFVSINGALHIDDPANLLDVIPKRLRFTSASKPPHDELREEADELLRKLFHDWDRVQLQPLSQQNGGYSKTIVFQVQPYSAGDPGALLIAKLGDHKLIEQEVTRYRQLIEGRVSNNRTPVAIRPAHRTRTMGGIVYTFIGLGGRVYDFADFYQQVDNDKQIDKVITNLFSDTLALQHGSTGAIRTRHDMRDYYVKKLRLDQAELAEKLDELLKLANARYKSVEDTKFWLADGTRMVNPLTYARSNDFTANYFETIIHGDLHAHNVLIDRHLDTWLIDFADADRGPRLQDYVSFETSLAVENVGCDDPALLHEWARVLYMARFIQMPELSDKLMRHSGMKKAHRAIVTLRRLGLNRPTDTLEEAEKTYLHGLFFTMLRLMTVKFLPPTRRLLALFAASYIAQRLQASR